MALRARRRDQARGLDSAPDFITVDSGDGGTGAAPMPLVDTVGPVVRESLPMLVDTLSAMIAHSCGAAEPRELRRHHCRIVTESGRSVRLDELYPARAPGAGTLPSARAS